MIKTNNCCSERSKKDEYASFSKLTAYDYVPAVNEYTHKIMDVKSLFIADKQCKNVAFAELYINNSAYYYYAVSGWNSNRQFLRENDYYNFKNYNLQRYKNCSVANKRNTPKHYIACKHKISDKHIRITDSEILLLEYIYGSHKNEILNSDTAKLKIYSERSLCRSCSNVLFNQFMQDFPNIEIQIYYTYDYDKK